MKVGLALGSGGARGLAHVGVIKALQEAGVPVDVIAGSSMGALVGAAYASNLSVDGLEEFSREFTWRSMFRLFLPTISREGLIDGKKIKEILQEKIGCRTFEELRLPLALETTDLETGELYTLTQGDLISAVRASISIPLVFTPVRLDGRILVDGGLVSPVPVKSARLLGADFVIGVNVLAQARSWLGADRVQRHFQNGSATNSSFLSRFFANEEKKLASQVQRDTDLGFMLILTQTIGISVSRLATFQLKIEKPDLLIEPDTSAVNIYDFHRGGELIDQGYQLTRQLLEQNGKLIRRLTSS